MTTTAKSLSEQLRAMDWQQIETADKDADRLLLGIVRKDFIEEVHVGGYRYAINDDEVSCWWSDQSDDEILPTHWTTIPSLSGESSLLPSAASALEDAEREREQGDLLLNNLSRDLSETQERAAFAEAKLAEAVKVMEPFAQKADRYNDIPGLIRTHDNVELWQLEDNKGMRVDITVGDLRAARSFLASVKGEEA